MHPSSKISGKATEEQFKAAVKSYYETVYGTDIWVTRILKDADDNEVSTEDEAKKYEYEIKLQKLIAGVSTSQI